MIAIANASTRRDLPVAPRALAITLVATLSACFGSPDSGEASSGSVDQQASRGPRTATILADTIAFYYEEPLNETLYIAVDSPAWTDTVKFYKGEPLNDTMLLLLGKQIGDDQIQRAAIDALIRKIHGLESDQELRAGAPNPDSILVGLRGTLSQWEASLAGEEQVVEWMDSIRCVFRSHMAEMRRSGDTVATIDHHRTTLRELEAGDSLIRMETADVLGAQPPPLHCP